MKRLQTDLPTNMCKAICALFFEGEQNKEELYHYRGMLYNVIVGR